MISKREKYWIHQYARWARMNQPEYRDLLKRVSGKTSCADRAFSHEDVDRVMAALETILWHRIDEGIVTKPVRNVQRFYWRHKCPHDGMINSRLRYKLDRLWNLLADYLPAEQRNDRYLAGIMAKDAGVNPSTFLDGDRIAWHRIPAECARIAVEALKDRLKYAVRAPA